MTGIRLGFAALLLAIGGCATNGSSRDTVTDSPSDEPSPLVTEQRAALLEAWRTYQQHYENDDLERSLPWAERVYELASAGGARNDSELAAAPLVGVPPGP